MNTKPLKIHVPAAITPTYANFAVIDTKQGEVVLNFCFAEGDEDAPTAVVTAKVVLHPQNAREFADALGRTLEGYETRHGPLS